MCHAAAWSVCSYFAARTQDKRRFHDTPKSKVRSLLSKREVSVAHFKHVSVVEVPSATVGGPRVVGVSVGHDALPLGSDIPTCPPQVANVRHPRHLPHCVGTVNLDVSVSPSVSHYDTS
jgi:hypothetical protein